MARAKVYRFSDHEQKGAIMARALGHPARIRILELIGKMGPVPYDVIVSNIPLSKGTLNQHLAIIKRADLLETVELLDGRSGYGLRERAREEAWAFMHDLLAA